MIFHQFLIQECRFKMSLFYNPIINLETDSFIFSPEESKHIYKVLRKVPGEIIKVTDGKGLEWRGKLTKVGNKNTEAEKIESTIIKDIRYDLEIAIAPTKNNHRIEWFIEKATEIGIKKIHFIKTENSERKVINLNRFKKIAINAMKQSKQFYLPEIIDIIKYKDFLLIKSNYQRLIAHCNKNNRIHLADISLEFKPLIVLIGPEGDFSKNEVKAALLKKFLPISLGNQRLRTETAALYVTQTISILSHLQKIS